MVKNLKGGKNHKKFGRKFSNAPVSHALRLSTDPNEIYACCSKIYGGSNIEVKCVDDVDRLCVMRNKFRGRGKRDNTICVGTWLLVGKREFETVKEGKKETCDLLEVYKDTDKEKLQQSETSVNWSVLKQIKTASESFVNNEDNDMFGFDFSNDKLDEIEQLIENSTEMVSAATNNDEIEDDIDIDDI